MYRYEPPHHHANRSASDIATPIELFANNGTTAHFAFPCWYQEIKKPVPAHHHNRQFHDYIGWPEPSRPDRSCQLWLPDRGHCLIDPHWECTPHCSRYIDYSHVIPIHLLSEDEGYSSASVAWATEDKKAPEGITVEAWIDPVEDWVVRVSIDCADPTAVFDPSVYLFTVFVNADERTTANPKTGEAGLIQPKRSDIVALAKLKVLPSAYVERTESNDEEI